ncbi:Mitochondrial basic amino acids transporter isoform 1 [Schistosoma japonicum]|nr:Mitochondrial basic amino acids transporter isoform 1 [Schistosoma japonicum]
MVSRESLNEFLSGAIGGLAGLTVGHPMDTVKVIMQNSPKNLSCKEVTFLISQIGIKRFFTGLSVPFYSYGFINAVIFTVYKKSLSILDATGQSPLANAMAGAIAGVVQLIPAVPIEVIKIQQQSKATYPGEKQLTARKCIHTILRMNGFTGLYSGTIIQGFRDVPGFTTYFYTYSECIKIGKYIDLSTFWSAFIGGAIGGTLSWCVSMPFDIIKTRQQVDNGIKISNVINNLLNEKNYKIFFRGFNVVITRAFLVNACTFSVYETVYEYLTQH